MQKTFKMTETKANGYSSESIRQEHSNEYQNDRVYSFQKSLHSCALVESSLSNERVNIIFDQIAPFQM